MENQTIKFEVTLDEANGILAALGRLPFDTVAGLIEKLKAQGAAQVQAQQEQPKAE